MVKNIDCSNALELMPLLNAMARKISFDLSSDLTQEAFTDLYEYLLVHGRVDIGYAVTMSRRTMFDYYIANRTPVYIPSRSMRMRRLLEHTKQLARAWQGVTRYDVV